MKRERTQTADPHLALEEEPLIKSARTRFTQRFSQALQWLICSGLQLSRSKCSTCFCIVSATYPGRSGRCFPEQGGEHASNDFFPILVAPSPFESVARFQCCFPVLTYCVYTACIGWIKGDSVKFHFLSSELTWIFHPSVDFVPNG